MNNSEQPASPLITVELIYPLVKEQLLFNIQVPIATTVKQAIELSGILEKYPEIDLNQNKVGIFSKVCQLNTPLREGDRIEIYRPLIADPKEARIKKVAAKKS